MKAILIPDDRFQTVSDWELDVFSGRLLQEFCLCILEVLKCFRFY